MKTSSRIRRKGEMFRVSMKHNWGDSWLKCLLGIVDKPHRAGIAPLSPWFPGKPGFPAKPVRPGCPGSPRDPVLPGGPGGPGGPGVLLRYPEGIWLSSMSTLLIWPSNKEDASERFRTETFKINSQSYMKHLTHCSQAVRKLVGQWSASCSGMRNLPGKQRCCHEAIVS